MRLRRIIPGVLVLFSLSCSENEDKKRFDQTQLLTNLSQNVIIPAYQSHLANVEILKVKVAGFTTALTVQSLADAKSAWLTAALSWKRAEIFNFGPVDDLSIETTMDFWPVSTTGIENSVADYDGSSEYLEGIGSNKKGLAAIEYLLFHADAESVLTEFSDEKRREYLNLLSEDLTDQIDNLLQVWVTSYVDEFAANTGNDSRASAVLVANQLLILLDEVKNSKLGAPAGALSGSGPRPDLVESLFAGNSMEMIRANLDAIELVFTGGTGTGFDDYLSAYPRRTDGSEPLHEIIKLQLEKCREEADFISIPLEEAVNTQAFQVEQLITDLTLLNAYLKTDMMSRLNLVITFTDNDGD